MTTRDELLQKLRIADLEYQRDMLGFMCFLLLVVLAGAAIDVGIGGCAGVQ